jgi:MYXO-CTERM domain-containing protein
VFTGVSLLFETTAQPVAMTRFEGVEWQVEDSQISSADQTVMVTPTGGSSQPVAATFVGSWDSSLDLVFTPSVSVCIDILGCWELIALGIPLELGADSFEQAFPVTELDFPLPVIDSEVRYHDFGEIEIGQLANFELPIANVGDLDLEGVVGQLGSPFFSVYPDYILAGPAQTDGVVVTFAPTSAGSFSGTLVIESNDPFDPVYEVVIVGEGVSPESEDTDSAEDDGPAPQVVSSELDGCGCSSASHSALPALTMWMLAGLVAVRRRQPVR